MERLVHNEKQCWANNQYSSRECLEVVAIPTSVGDKALEDKEDQIFQEIKVEVGGRNTQSCHQLQKGKLRTIKFSTRKQSQQILRNKKQLCDVDSTVRDLQQGTKRFTNEILYAYYGGIWNKCKKLLIHQYYKINGTVCIKVEENGSSSTMAPLLCD